MRLLAPALIFCGAIASFGQTPQVPHKMQFAGMTLTIRDDARREIQVDVDALTRSPKYFGIKAERAKTYFPIIEQAFEEERLPVDFKYLALQESALIPDAVSTSNAVGFWQFKDFTAIEMGLRVDKDVDERMNIASASRAAARYLKQCNHYFNNWVYALQSYQMGAGGVMRLVGDKDLGSRHMEITSETYWYVKKFLAHKIAFESVGGKGAMEMTVLRNAGGKSLAEISREASMDEEKVREFNKWLKTDRIPEDKEYAVLIPKGESTPGFSVLYVAAASKGSSVPVKPVVVATETKEINGIPVIMAREGETLSALVARADVSMSRFLNYNEMDIDKPVQSGQWYFLAKKKKHGPQELYTTGPGEDVWAVSQRFGVRMKSLMKYNDLDQPRGNVDGMTLYLAHHRPGSVMEVPDSVVAVLDEEGSFDWDVSLSPTRSTPTASARPLTKSAVVTPEPVSERNPVAPGGGVHEVKASDTLYSVARQYGVTIQEIMEWNGKRDFSLSVGEKLKVAAH